MNEEDKIKVEIKEIKYNSEEYRQELQLRDKVLRKPLGMNLYDEYLEAEKHDFHIGAFLNNQLVGVLVLTNTHAGDVKMRQFAVAEQWQGKKIGTKLVVFAEEYSKQKGINAIVLNARKGAVGFYEKQGYEKISEEFQEINIPHYKMNKKL